MFVEEVTKWYKINKRDLPWRGTKNPYIIWLSEIILQQTRVEQGLPYFYKFTERYKSVTEFADASEDEILKLWQGLGYYSRARNMHATAKIIKNEHKGVFPCNYETLLKLKGIGEYTAAAISSFSCNEKHAVVDGNVYRLLSRYFGIKTAIDSTSGKKQFKKLAYELLETAEPFIYNQAVMEFGAIQCKPAAPLCENCPLRLNCYAFNHNVVDQLPVKEKKTKVKERFFNYLVLKENDSYLLNKRTGKDIWQNMYDFPLIETSDRVTESELLQHIHFENFKKNGKLYIKSVSEEKKHVLSHQIIYARFWEITLENMVFDSSNSVFWVGEDEMDQYAFPKLVDNYLKKF